MGKGHYFQESTNQQSSGYKYKESYQLPWPMLKYQLTIEPLLQYLIGLDLVIVFFPFDSQNSYLWLTLCTDPKYVTNSSNLNRYCWLQNSSLHQ